MIKSFFRDSLIYLIPIVISRGINIILVPLYTKVLIPADYGAFDMLIIFGNFVNITVALEIGQGVARFYPEETDSNNKVFYVSTAFWFIIICYSVFCIFALFAASWLSQIIIGHQGYEKFFKLGLVYFWFNGILIFLQNQFRWEFRSKDYSITGVLVAFTTIGVSILLAYFLALGLKGILYGMISGVAVGSLYGVLRLKTSISFTFHPDRLVEMLKFSIPLVPSSIAVYLTLYIDRWMINHYLSLRELGLYGVGYRLSNIVFFVMVSFQLSLSTYIYANYKEKHTPSHIAEIFRIFSVLALLCFIGISLFSKEILWFMTSSDYYNASSVVIFLVPAILFSNMYIFAPGIGIAKKTAYILWINICGAAINTLLNYILIPWLGINGAGLAKLASYIIVFIVYMIISQRLYYVPYNWRLLLSALLGSIIIIIVPLLMKAGVIIILLVKFVLILYAILFFIKIGLIKKTEIEYVRFFLKKKRIQAN